MCECEYPEFFSRTIRTARKTHKCCECSRTINPRDKYDYSSGKWKDYVGSYKTCLECSKLKTWLDKKTDCCVAFGELWAELIESGIVNGDYRHFCQVVSYTDEIEMVDGFLRLRNNGI